MIPLDTLDTLDTIIDGETYRAALQTGGWEVYRCVGGEHEDDWEHVGPAYTRMDARDDVLAAVRTAVAQDRADALVANRISNWDRQSVEELSAILDDIREHADSSALLDRCGRALQDLSDDEFPRPRLVIRDLNGGELVVGGGGYRVRLPVDEPSGGMHP